MSTKAANKPKNKPKRKETAARPKAAAPKVPTPPAKYVAPPSMVTITRVKRDGTSAQRTFANGLRDTPSNSPSSGGWFQDVVARVKHAGYTWAAQELALGTHAALNAVVDRLSEHGLGGFLQVLAPGHSLAEYDRVAAAIKANPSLVNEAMNVGEIPGHKTGFAAGLDYLQSRFADAAPSPALTSGPTTAVSPAKNIVSSPLSTGVSLKGFNPTAKAVNTPFGPGMDLMVQMPLCLVRSDAAGSISLAAYGTTTINAGGNGIEIGPDTFGDRLASFASLYTRWKPVHFKFKYTANCPTTTAGSVVIGVSADPDSTVSSNIASLMQLQPSALCPVWSAETDVDTYTDRTDEWYYTDIGTTSTEKRLENCGEVFLALSGAPATTSLGIFWVCARVILAGPCPDNGITVASHLLRNRPLAIDVFEKMLSEANWLKVLQTLDIKTDVCLFDGQDPADSEPIKAPPYKRT